MAVPPRPSRRPALLHRLGPARFEARLAIEAIADRWPDLKLVTQAPVKDPSATTATRDRGDRELIWIHYEICRKPYLSGRRAFSFGRLREVTSFSVLPKLGSCDILSLLKRPDINSRQY